jgi:hypothetical protein
MFLANTDYAQKANAHGQSPAEVIKAPYVRLTVLGPARVRVNGAVGALSTFEQLTASSASPPQPSTSVAKTKIHIP